MSEKIFTEFEFNSGSNYNKHTVEQVLKLRKGLSRFHPFDCLLEAWDLLAKVVI
jgi:hypothetical protein